MNSGIYEIKNLKTGRSYIGSSKNMFKRFKEHLTALRRGNHINVHLQRSFDKHGEDLFKFNVIEYTEDLFEREAYHIEQSDIIYNIGVVGGGDNLSNHPDREEIIKRITESCKESYANLSNDAKLANKLRNSGTSNPNYCKSHSLETRKRMADKRVEFFNSNPDAKDAISQGMTRYWKSMTPDEYAFVCHTRSKRMTDNNHFKGKSHTDDMKQAMSSHFKEKFAAMNSEERYALNPQTKKVEIDGIVYYGLSEAGRQLCVSPATLLYRIKSNSTKWKGYRYLD